MRYFLQVKYKGTAFHGSQLQGELPTVQLEINRALSVLLRREILSFGASRTDEGVHALANFYHFDCDHELLPKFRYQLNAVLPREISVEAVYKAASPNANARFDVLSRKYRYRIYQQKDPFLQQRAHFFPYAFDPSILKETAATLLEYSGASFESFSKRNTQSKTFICSIFQSHWEFGECGFEYVVEANRFLRGMVRALVGTQLKAARGKTTLEGFRKIIESKDCRLADFSMPGHGLYLEGIKYPEGQFSEVF